MSEKNVAHKISSCVQKKKQAANDAQLLMNRIALLQKEEERARKKIDQTKDRAEEIMRMRLKNEERMRSYMEASLEEQQIQRELHQRNKELEQQTKTTLSVQHEKIFMKRREDAHMMLNEKRSLTKQMIKDQERELRLKQKKRDEVRQHEEEAKLKREEEKRENDRRMREYYEKKAEAEANELKRAEKLVKELEKKERQWMSKLKEAQSVQESAYHHLEYALSRNEVPSESLIVSSSIRQPLTPKDNPTRSLSSLRSSSKSSANSANSRGNSRGSARRSSSNPRGLSH